MSGKNKFATCLGCGCVCDDIEPIPGQPFSNWHRLCHLGREWSARPRPPHPCWVDGRPAELSHGLDVAAEWLDTATAPHFEALSGMTTEAQQAMLDLAEHLRASVEIAPLAADSIPQIMARQGWVTATLGEIRQRCDAVVCWFCDPAATHPRFFERYTAMGARRLFIDDAAQSVTPGDRERISCDYDEAVRLVNALRMRFGSGSESGSGTGHDEEGEEFSTLRHRHVAEWLAGSSHVVHLIGEMIGSENAPLADAIAALAREMNGERWSVALRLANSGNLLGAERVLGWMTAAAERAQFPVDPKTALLSYAGVGASPRSLADLIVRGPGSGGSPSTPENTKMIWLVDSETEVAAALSGNARVVFGVGRPGLDCGGTWTRMDHVSLPLWGEPANSGLLSAFELCESLGARLADRRAQAAAAQQ